MVAPAAHVDAPHGAAAAERELRLAVAADVFERLAAGFVDGRRRRGTAQETDASLAEVFAGTLLLLSRVLFLLSAESRGLLPADGPYARHGIGRIRERVAELRAPGERLNPQSADLWRELAAVFDLVARGSASVGLPAYGGIFAAGTPAGRFLRDHSVSDFFLVPALDKLSRDAEGGFYDFAPLGPDDVAGVLDGVHGLRLAADERGKPVLVDPRGERKASPHGALPRWIVEYVVAEAVGPALAEREAAYRAAVHEAAARRERLHEAPPESAARLAREAAALEDRAADALLSLRVADPAMGSGRFLVHAADLAARRLGELLREMPRGPLSARVAEVRAGIAAGVRAQGLEPDPARLGDDALLRRIVVRRCLFGVDVDPAAVEAARLALSLAGFVPGAPLPRLDHHLKCGNALAGARVAELQRAMEENPQGQFDAFGGPFRGLLRAAAAIREVAASADASPAEAAEGARRHEELEGALAPYKRLLDVWMSRGFGNRLAEEMASLHADEVVEAARGGRGQLGRAHAEALERAAGLAREHRFFHWDLEFPEAFVDAETATWSEDPGFDAVIGRPPASRGEHGAALRPHLAHAFAEVYDASADLHAYFWQMAMTVLRRGGRVAFAAAERWMRSGPAEGLRRFLAQRAEMERLVDFRAAAARVEPDAACVVVARRPGPDGRATAGETQVTVLPAGAGAEPRLAAYAAAHSYAVPRGRFGGAPWSLERPEVQRLIDRITAAGVPLADYMGAAPAGGIRTGLNDAFVVDAETRDRIVHAHAGAAHLVRPLVRAGEIERWAADWRGAWLIAIPSSEEHAWPWTGAGESDAEHLFARSFPTLHAYLKPWEERLRARHDQGRYWWELRPRTEREHAGPKIVHADSAAHPQFAYAAAEVCVLANACVWPAADPYLLAVANSPVAWTWLWRSALHGRDDVLRLTPSAVEALPVALPTPELKGEIDGGVERIVELTTERRGMTEEMMAWLRSEYHIAPPDAALAAFADLNATAFVDAVRRHRVAHAEPLAPREVGMLRNAHAEYAPRLTSVQAKAAGLERRISQLVVRAYGLSPDEVELMWSTAPPRMPGSR
ncbi:Eco57I restriction-modification methylase domain-containing protein [Longimicrobium sp.]|uniref:Eco57I restriction-modification methylase domain-containing protein n=1 Tax=Longimicrobium sp. TaxID=2029185 RepID=UPI0039C911FD